MDTLQVDRERLVIYERLITVGVFDMFFFFYSYTYRNLNRYFSISMCDCFFKVKSSESKLLLFFCCPYFSYFCPYVTSH